MANSGKSEEKIIYTAADGVGHIVLNRPAAYNAFDESMAEQLGAALDRAEADPKVRAILITGAGKAFCAGGDVGFFHREVTAGTLNMAPLLGKLGQAALKMKKLPKPIITSVQGAAAGAGFSLALLGDFCIAAASAKFIQAFVNVGLAPDTGSAYLLAKAIGTVRTADYIMTGRAIGAEEALQAGFISQVVPEEELASAAQALAAKLAAGPTEAFGAMKEQLFLTAYSDFEAYLKREQELQLAMSKTSDFKEGVTAFVEKRKAHFTGRHYDE